MKAYWNYRWLFTSHAVLSGNFWNPAMLTMLKLGYDKKWRNSVWLRGGRVTTNRSKASQVSIAFHSYSYTWYTSTVLSSAFTILSRPRASTSAVVYGNHISSKRRVATFQCQIILLGDKGPRLLESGIMAGRELYFWHFDPVSDVTRATSRLDCRPDTTDSQNMCIKTVRTTEI